jgi:hypothetical protein
MGTQAQPRRQSRFALLLGRPRASRLIATLGIVVTTVGLYVPVAGRDLFVNGGLIRSLNTWTIGNSVRAPLASLHLERMPLPVYLGFEAVYSVLTLGGLALIPLLWRPLSPKGTAVMRWAYAAWPSLLTILAVAGLPAWWKFMSQPPQELLPGATITIEASYLLPGAVVFPLGVLLCGVALALMLREPLPRAVPATAPRTGWQWTAALLLTVGALVWGIGFYLMPEAVTAACPFVNFSVTQFAHGACAGLDSDQVRQAAYNSGLNPIALFFYSVSWNYELLVAAAGITTLGGWTRLLSMATLAWLAVWPAVALGVALVALHGARLIAQHGFHLTATSAGWHVGPGMVVTFVGIGLVALGQVGLWRELVRRKGAASA